MAIANLKETLDFLTLRANQLNFDIGTYTEQRRLNVESQGDVMSVKFASEREIKTFYKSLYEDDTDLQEKYKDYTEIPDFEDELDRIAAEYQEKINDLTAAETILSNQITEASAELEEINAQKESFKSMLTNNISQDYDYGIK